MSQFDPTATDTLPSGATIPGAIVWLVSCSACVHGSSFQKYYFKNLAPRFGLAYAITPNLVFRGGYGITYQPPIQNGWGPLQFMGYQQNITRFRAAGQLAKFNPLLYLSDFKGGPAPGPLGLPTFTGTLPNQDPTSMNGYNPDFYPPSLAMPLIQNFSAGFQYKLPHEAVLEANYVGSTGERLFNKSFGNQFDQAPGKYMGLGDLLGEDMQGDLSNPTTAATLAGYGITHLPYPTFESDNNAIYSTNSVRGFDPLPAIQPVDQ